MREVSSGSSEKHSKPRPLSGVRMMFMVGARRTSTPLLRASLPSAVAISSTRSTSHVAAMATGQGSEVEGLEGSKGAPLPPAGLSEVISCRNPTALSACSAQESAPVNRWTFCSRVSRASRPDSSLRTPVGTTVMDDLLVCGGCRGRLDAGRDAYRVERAGDWLELHEEVRHLRVARWRIHVRGRLCWPARVVGAVDAGPVGSCKGR